MTRMFDRSTWWSRSRRAGILAAAMIALPSGSSHAIEPPSPCDGSFESTVSGLWDLSGSLSGQVLDLEGISGSAALDIVQDPKGKLTGFGLIEFCENEDCCQGTCTAKGTVKRVRSTVRVFLVIKILAVCSIFDQPTTLKLTETVRLELDEATRTLVGTVSVRGSVCVRGYGCMSIQKLAKLLEEEEGIPLILDTYFEAPVEDGMDGTGELSVRVQSLDRKRLLGDATLELSNGKSYAFAVIGKNYAKRNRHVLKLKGDPLMAKGLNFNLTLDCATGQALLKGKFGGSKILQVLDTSSP